MYLMINIVLLLNLNFHFATKNGENILKIYQNQLKIIF